MSDWTRRPLGELADISMGRTPPRGDPASWDSDRSGSNVWVSIADMTAASGGVVTDSKEYISDSAAAAGRLVPAGTLLMSFKLSIGRLAFAGTDLFTNEAIAALRVADDAPITKRYLYHYLSSLDWVAAARGNEKVKGATLNLAKLAALPVDYPSPEQQHEIVSVLDSSLKQSTAYRTALQHERMLVLDHYRSAARSLLQGVLDDGAPEKSLADVLQLVIDHRGKTPAKLGGDFTGNGVPVISAIHLKGDTIKWDERERFVTQEMFERWMPERLKAGDVLLTSEAPLGQVAVVPSDDPLVLSQRLFALRADPELLANDFLFEFLRSPLGQERLLERATGATAVGIRQSELMKVLIPVPELGNQEELAGTLASLRGLIFNLVGNIDARLGRCDDLYRSILTSAFRSEPT